MRKAVVAGSVLLFALAGCGGNPADSYQKTDPATIAADAHAALKATTGIHVTGTLQVGNQSMAVDLTSDSTGALSGTVTLAGSTLQVLGTPGAGGRIYLKADQDFWAKVAPQNAAQLAGAWVANADPLPRVLQQLTLPKLIANEARYRWESEKPTLVGTGNVNGTSTVQISLTDGVSSAKETLDVSASAPHHVVRETEGSDFTLTFDQFGATVTASAPAPADVVDLLKVIARK